MSVIIKITDRRVRAFLELLENEQPAPESPGYCILGPIRFIPNKKTLPKRLALFALYSLLSPTNNKRSDSYSSDKKKPQSIEEKRNFTRRNGTVPMLQRLD